MGWTSGLLAILAVAAAAADPEPTLRMVRGGEVVAEPSVTALRAACRERTLSVADPYYEETRRFRVCPLSEVLALGFGDLGALRGQALLLRARDGYTRSAPADQLLGPGAHLAFADADRLARGEQGFDPIDRREVDPAPFYLVWAGPDQSDTHVWPWPYQLATIEIARFEEAHPHTVPTGAAAGSPPDRGYGLFQKECAHCHAINGEGGKVGPELNVPQNITAYRPEAQIRAYIRNPRTFRYTNMPSHEHLSEQDLDALLAYLRHMRAHPSDPSDR